MVGGEPTINLEIPLLLLLVLADVDVVDIVLDAEFLEGARDFLAVGSSGCIAADAMLVQLVLMVCVRRRTDLCWVVSPSSIYQLR